MKKNKKTTQTRMKANQLRQKTQALRGAFKAAEKAGTDPVVSQAFVATAPDFLKPFAESSTTCSTCRHGVDLSPVSIVCRSFLSPRAGLAHVPDYACGYGREHDGQAAA